jgi:hypothetical protein
MTRRKPEQIVQLLHKADGELAKGKATQSTATSRVCFLQVKKCPLYYQKGDHFTNEKEPIFVVHEERVIKSRLPNASWSNSSAVERLYSRAGRDVTVTLSFFCPALLVAQKR